MKRTKKLKLLFILLSGFNFYIYAQNINEFHGLEGNYLGQKPPGIIPEVFAPGVVSVENKNTHALSISPDGKTMVFSRYPDRTSYIMTFDSGKWNDPVESFFFGKEVSFSADGKKIFYYTEGDIFYVEKNEDKWSRPIKLGSEINTSETEYYPSIVNDGSIYFSRDGNWSTGRIMYSKYKNGKFLEAVDLGETINKGGALHAWVAPDESYMLFNSSRKGSNTKLDIWISWNINGKWNEPQNLGEKINSGADAVLCPTISPDGKYMCFTRLNFRTNTGYIYWVSTKLLDSLKSAENNSIGVKTE